jgi:hypothetical protein
LERALHETSQILFFLICATVSLSSSTKAAEEPENVANMVEQAAKSCRQMGGKPDTEAILAVNDLNGDGVEDWVVDYGKLKCDGIRQANLDCDDSQHNCPHPDLRSKKQKQNDGGGHGSFSNVATK